MQQIYVSEAYATVAEQLGLKVNKKNGCTISVQKLNGWANAWGQAMKVGGWPKKRA